VFGIEGDPSKAATLDRLWQQAQQCTPTSQVAEYTQGIMDLGAMVCTRSRPRCSSCPMNPGCIAARDGRQADLPSPRRPRERPAREVTLLLAESRAQGIRAVLLERRAESGVWGGLWSPPQFENSEAALAWCRQELGEPVGLPQPLPPIDHAFTHFDLRLHPLRVRCDPVAWVDEGSRLWYTLAAPPRIGLPKPIKTLIERLED
jgi:A/G-specific adenine glycosylase